ncbi:cation diffusion facilitator family transporter [Shimia sp. FJ5]|uniref:cation diffusion facilitator family transporter n=1 Tax=Shimia sp. FJ5 TaxID=3079054 RepID=UPI00260E49F3|nr:cation diffusion facilitator family transporter [Shimia sp. FJ5]MDV4144910.1 cation diffusion facilitator family transporter [Shimia sp. FJ5]
MPHDHHHHALPDTGDTRVLWAVIVNVALTLAQIVAGVISGSLAMIADAIHNLSDALSLIIAFFARRIARRPADADMTFGYGRAEVVAALVNYTTLIVIALYLVSEGIGRLFNPIEVEGWIVVIVAGIAFVVDAVTALLIMRLSRDSVNMRAAFLHNIADALGSIAVIVAGVLILLYDWRLIDPILTLVIAGYILWHSATGLRPVIRILMLASPDDPPLEEVLAALEGMPGVASIHHVHLWRMQEHEVSLDAHVVIDGSKAPAELRATLRQMLSDRFGIHHGMIEMETAEESCADAARIGH